MSDISATTDDPPTEEPPTTDQMNTKTDDAAQATCDESIAPIDSIQNVVGDHFYLSEISLDTNMVNTNMLNTNMVFVLRELE